MTKSAGTINPAIKNPHANALMHPECR